MSVTLILIFVGIGAGAFAFYRWATKNNDYFAKRGLPHEKPLFLLGSTASLFFQKVDMVGFIEERFAQFPNEK